MGPFVSSTAATYDDGLLHLSATELRAGYRDHAFSPLEVIHALLARIDTVNESLRCFLSINAEDAVRTATAAQRAWSSGDTQPPLCGIPVSLKDGIESAGMPTTYGSVAFKDNFQPDSEIAARLRRAGAVIFGKTNLSEFALTAVTSNRLGPDGRNPWNLEHTCGGSSGGAAAAVAAGLGPLAVGTDSAGSIRCPGSYNGVFGFKPTYQRIPSVQRWRAAPGRSHNGPITRTVGDAALLLVSLSGPHLLDPESNPAALPDYASWPIREMSRCRVALAPGGLRDSTRDHADLVGEVGKILDEHRCEIFEAHPPPYEPFEGSAGIWPYAGDHYAAAESLCPDFWRIHHQDLTEYARPIYDAGRHLPAWQYRQALSHDQSYRNAVRAWFDHEQVDLLITPAPGPAPLLRKTELTPAARMDDLLAFNVSRNPAAVVPMGFNGTTGLPLAVQIVGRYGGDLTVLQASAIIESAKPWAGYWPATPKA